MSACMPALVRCRAWRRRSLVAICTVLSEAVLVNSPVFVCRHEFHGWQSAGSCLALHHKYISVSGAPSAACCVAASSFDNLARSALCFQPRIMANLEQQTDGEVVSAKVKSDEADGRRQEGGVWFHVSDSLELVLHRGDITKWCVDGKSDAIVNAANPRMLGGGGVDGAIHKRAGPALRKACEEIPEVSPDVRCPTGEARVTKGFQLPVSRVIHTVGPVYYEEENPEELLKDSYRNSLKAAIQEGVKYIAFPAISCGVYGYPAEKAATTSLAAVKEDSAGLSEIHFVLFEQKTYSAWLEEAGKQFQKI